MSKNCSICGNNTIFYIWSSTRNFPIDKYIGKMEIRGRKAIYELKHSGRPVCFKCFDELKK